LNHQALLFPELELEAKRYKNGNANKLDNEDASIHNWYRFVLSFPPHLVREYIRKFNLKSRETILDPFCGTGTTLVEAKLQGLHGIGIEANPMAYFASRIKTDFDIDPDILVDDSFRIAEKAESIIKHSDSKDLNSLTSEESSLLLRDSISPIPLHKTLILLNTINEFNSKFKNHQLLALATSTIKNASNLHFGPEVGVSKRKKLDADVIYDWIALIKSMANDIRYLEQQEYPPSHVYHGDSREMSPYLRPHSIDAVFTSPPYPNEKDYTRSTRLESVLLGFIKDKAGLREIKKSLLRSNSRNVYKGDDDDKYITNFPNIISIADEIENKRIKLNKTSGFEKMYHKITKLYFGGMARHLQEMKPYLKKNSLLGYVVGDQASYLQVHIPTGEIISDIAEHLGYSLISIDLFRTRFATVTKKEMREEVVVLEWKG